MALISESKFECIPLQWDTDYFGVNSARVNLNGFASTNDQDAIIDFCKDYSFVTMFNRDNLNENNLWIGRRTNAFLADMNVQFLKILTEIPRFHDENTYIFNKFLRNDQIIEIAKKSFSHSRFFNDPQVPKDRKSVV